MNQNQNNNLNATSVGVNEGKGSCLRPAVGERIAARPGVVTTIAVGFAVVVNFTVQVIKGRE